MKYGQLFAENLNDVTMTSSPIRIFSNSNINLPRAYLSDKLNFILIRHKRAEIQNREVLGRKNVFYVTLTLTFDPRSPILNRVRAQHTQYFKNLKFYVRGLWVRASPINNHLAKTLSKPVHPFGWNFVH